MNGSGRSTEAQATQPDGYGDASVYGRRGDNPLNNSEIDETTIYHKN